MKIKLLLCLLCFFSFTTSSLAQIKVAQKINQIAQFDCEELKVISSNFSDEINKFVGSKGYIIVYEGKNRTRVYDKNGKFQRYKYFSPPHGQLNARIQGIRRMLHMVGAQRERFRIIKGGFRNKFDIEFWIVPNGAKPPKITPTLKKMNYKGSFQRFLYMDC